jgi:hypothetical protein
VKIPLSPCGFAGVAHTGEKGELLLSIKENTLVLTPTDAPQCLVAKQSNPILNSAPAAPVGDE